jgi:hypothetical protein
MFDSQASKCRFTEEPELDVAEVNAPALRGASVAVVRQGRRLRGAGAGLAFALLWGYAGPATALPGQTIPAFKAWAAGQKLLAGLAPHKDELSGRPAFELQTTDRGISWRFSATSDGTTIRRESLAVGQVGKAPGTEPIRHDGHGYGFTFFATLYGRGVAADFQAAPLVASVKDPTNGRVTRYYRGHRYGYAETGGLVLETLAAFKSDLAQAQRCAKAPQSCSE